MKGAGIDHQMTAVGCDRGGDRFPKAAGPNGESLQGGLIFHDCGVANAVDELAADAHINRRDQPKPETGEARRQKRHRDHKAFKPALAGVFLHQAAVRDAVSPPISKVRLPSSERLSAAIRYPSRSAMAIG